MNTPAPQKRVTDGDGLAPAFAAVRVRLGLVATLFAHETYDKDVDEPEAEERELVRERRFDRERFREPAGKA